MTDYGTKIAELRAANKMTQAQLGSMLNVTSQAVSKWENGLSEPDIESIKKICEIFHISFDEFFGATSADTYDDATDESETANGEIEETTSPAPTVVLAYCDTCDKPLYNPKEYQISIVNNIQHTTCLSCVAKKQEADKKAKENERVRQREMERSRNWDELKKGLLWGILGGGSIAVLAIIAGFVSEIATSEVLAFILGTVALSYGGYAMVAQLVWGNSVGDVFGFFFRTLKLPGVIFTLDLDGILFLIFVKIAGAILSALFTVLLFLLGLFVTLIYSMIIFPFALVKEIREL